MSDPEETQDSDSEYAHLPTTGLDSGGLDEFFGAKNEEMIDDINYPTPSSNNEC
jgi:hypothetical protein